MIRFRSLRRAIGLVVCLLLIGTGVWLVMPVINNQPRFGWFVLMGAGFIALGLGWLWTDYIEGDGG